MSHVQPVPPIFLPCPDGWMAVEDEATGVFTCDPFDEGGPLDCDSFGADYAHLLGNAECVHLTRRAKFIPSWY